MTRQHRLVQQHRQIILVLYTEAQASFQINGHLMSGLTPAMDLPKTNLCASRADVEFGINDGVPMWLDRPAKYRHHHGLPN